MAEVIHTIRTTVSEGGDSAVELTMQRVSGSLKPQQLPPQQVSSASNSAPSSISGTAVLGLRRPEHVRNVSSTNSLASAMSTNSLSDGLESNAHHRASANAPSDSTTAAGGAANAPSTGGPDKHEKESARTGIPLCVTYSFVGMIALDQPTASADLALVYNHNGGKAAEVPSVYLAAVHVEAHPGAGGEGELTLRTTLSSVSVHSRGGGISVDKLTESTVPLPPRFDASSRTCSVQLWSNSPPAAQPDRSGIRCTVLLSPAAASGSPPPHLSPPPVSLAWTADLAPTLLVQDTSWCRNSSSASTTSSVSSKGSNFILQRGLFFDLVPLQPVLEGSAVRTPPMISIQTASSTSRWSLRADPMSSPDLVAALVLDRVVLAVQLRFQQPRRDQIPLFLTRSNPLQRNSSSGAAGGAGGAGGGGAGVSAGLTDDSILAVASLLRCLSAATVPTAERSGPPVKYSPALIPMLERALTVSESMSIENVAVPRAPTTLFDRGLLQSVLRGVFPDSSSTSSRSSCADILQHVVALALEVPVERALWLTLLLKGLHREPAISTEDTSLSRRFLLSGPAVANFLWSNQLRQAAHLPGHTNHLLDLFLPAAASVEDHNTQKGPNESLLLSRLIPEKCDDILEHLTSLHAALWLHDPSVLVEVIYKQAIKSFKQHKSSIKVKIVVYIYLILFQF